MFGIDCHFRQKGFLNFDSAKEINVIGLSYSIEEQYSSIGVVSKSVCGRRI